MHSNLKLLALSYTYIILYQCTTIVFSYLQLLAIGLVTIITSPTLYLSFPAVPAVVASRLSMECLAAYRLSV